MRYSYFVKIHVNKRYGHGYYPAVLTVDYKLTEEKFAEFYDTVMEKFKNYRDWEYFEIEDIRYLGSE